MGSSRRSVQRLLLCLLTTFIAVPGLADSAGPLQSVSRLFQSKDSYTGPVATKVAEFKEDFVVGSMDFSPDGKNLAAYPEFDRMDVHLWDWRNQRLLRVLSTEAPAGGGYGIRYSPDGTLLVAGHLPEPTKNGFRILRVWDPRTGAVLHDFASPRGEGGASDGGAEGFAFTPDGKMFLRTADHLGKPGEYLVVYRTDTWEEIWGLPTLPFMPHKLAISPDGLYVALGGNSREEIGYLQWSANIQIQIVDLAQRKVVRTIEHALPKYGPNSLAWSPNGRFLAAGAIVPEQKAPDRDAVRIFDAATGLQIVNEPASDAAYVSGLSYSPDDRFLVEGYIDGRARIWDAAHKRLLQEIPVNDSFHTVLCISKDSRHLAIGDGKAVSIWEFKQIASAQ